MIGSDHDDAQSVMRRIAHDDTLAGTPCLRADLRLKFRQHISTDLDRSAHDGVAALS